MLEIRRFSPGLAGSITSLLVVRQVVDVLTIPAHRTPQTEASEARRLCRDRVRRRARTAPGPIILVGLGADGILPLIRAISIKLDGISPALTGTAVRLVFDVGEIGGSSDRYSSARSAIHGHVDAGTVVVGGRLCRRRRRCRDDVGPQGLTEPLEGRECVTAKAV